MPSGTVAFYVNSAPILGCAAAPLQQSTGVAQCITTALPSGSNLRITATYSGDTNFQKSSSLTPDLTQTVEDFLPKIDSTAGVTAGVVSVLQGYTNTSQPFNQQTITFTATSLYGFGDFDLRVTLPSHPN